MTPFLQMRLWWRRGSDFQRLATGLSIAIVLALTGWVLVPTAPDDDLAGTTVDAGSVRGADTAGPASESAEIAPGPTAAPGGVDSGGAAAPETGAGATGGAPVADPGGTPGGQAPAASPNCPGGTAPGVTDKEILIGIGLLSLAGPIGNSAAGQGTPEELKRAAQAVVADINGRGGVHCRKIVVKYYEGNPINPESQRANCLKAVQDRLLMFVDSGAFVFPPGAYNCLAQQRVPIVTPSNVLQSELTKFSPYLLSPAADADTAMRTVAYGARDVGMFDPGKGFKKLGLVMDDCSPEFNRALEGYLAKAGVAGDKVSKYVFACPPSGFAPPNTMAQAATQHRLDGVTHVIPLTGGGSFKPYTEAAEGQRFRPRYILTDRDGIIVTSVSSTGPNRDNFDRAVAITTTRYGLQTTPGLQLDASTRRCQGLITKAGLSADLVFKSGGTVCSVLWTAEAALKGMRTISREAVLPGAFNAGTVQLPFPHADSTFRAPRKFTGGDSWWLIEFQKECVCWRVGDANRKPSFAP